MPARLRWIGVRILRRARHTPANISPATHAKLFVRNASSKTSDHNGHVIKSPYKSIQIPSVTLPELIWSKIDRHPDLIAVECGLTGRKYTYTQLQKLSRRFAVSLLKAGFRPGQTVAIMTPNCIEHPILYLGVLVAGLIVTPINNVYTTDEISYQLERLQVSCVIAAPQLLDTVTEVISNLAAKNHATNVKIIALDNTREINEELPSNVIRFSDLVADHIDEQNLRTLRTFRVKPKYNAFYPYSSGTTGLPKGVELTHANIVSCVLQLSSPEIDIQTEATDAYQDVIPCVLPFYHVYGFVCVLMKSLFRGSKMVVLPKFEPLSYLEVLQNYKCSLLYLVPPLLSFIGTNPAAKEELFQHVRYILCGAAPFKTNDLDGCLQKMRKGSEFNFLQGYGTTEALAMIHPRLDCTNVNTIGSPLANTKVKVVHTTTGEILGPYKEGEICVKGPQVMKGYHNNPLATDSALNKEGWFRTGDIGYYDGDFNFFIVDRLKELIKVKGFQVAPAELEDLLRTHPAVTDVGVVGVPHDRSGEVPIAYIVKSPSHSVLTSEIQDFVAASVAPYKKLHDVVFVDRIPKSSTGKILRKDIKNEYLSKT